MMTKTMTALTAALMMAGTAGFAQTATETEPMDDEATMVAPDETMADDTMTTMDEPVQMGASTDGDEPPTETPSSTDLSGDEIIPLDAETASTDGMDTDPVEETIPAESAVETEGDTGLEEDGGAETSGMSEGEDLN